MAYFNVIKRQQRIIQIIRKQQPNLSQLIERLNQEGIDNCSQRTIQRDLEEIRLSFGLEIVFDKRLRVYSIKKDSGEARDAIYDYIDRATISESISKRLFDKNKTLNKQYIITDSPLFLEHNSGIQYFDPLLFACIEKRVVLISYSPKYQREKLQNYEVYPLALKEFRHRWYFICQKAQTANLYSFALDRIEELEITSKNTPKKGLINHEEAYETVYGISNPSDLKPIFIRIRATNSFSEYMKSIPWHSSQKIVEELEHETVFEFYLKPNFEFMQLILMQGSDVTVESPTSLIKSIKVTIKSMLDKYK
jgi:predicted DNA-binding transcriptional regulator YafY